MNQTPHHEYKYRQYFLRSDAVDPKTRALFEAGNYNELSSLARNSKLAHIGKLDQIVDGKVREAHITLEEAGLPKLSETFKRIKIKAQHRDALQHNKKIALMDADPAQTFLLASLSHREAVKAIRTINPPEQWLEHHTTRRFVIEVLDYHAPRKLDQLAKSWSHNAHISQAQKLALKESLEHIPMSEQHTQAITPLFASIDANCRKWMDLIKDYSNITNTPFNCVYDPLKTERLKKEMTHNVAALAKQDLQALQDHIEKTRKPF